MKHCPECNRNYADPTLSFCLEDGASLIFGNALNEPETAMLLDDRTSEAPTKELSRSNGALGPRVSNRNSLIAGAVGILLIIALGVGSYWYYGRGGEVIDSIAVMPFVNESGNADVDYLSDGMTETLINTLTQLPNLNVKPRSSTFRYKGRESEANVIGSELNVGAILNGRLVQKGDEITLFLSLIDTGTENQIWGKQYVRKLANLVTLQTEITRDVSESLKPKLSGTDQQRLTKNYTQNDEAYQLYLKGRFARSRRTEKDLDRAVEFFLKAIALDPDYALAYAGLADAYSGRALNLTSDPVLRRERLAKAREAALKALSIDNDLAEAHGALGTVVAASDYDFAGGEREYRRAIDINPDYADGHFWYAQHLSRFGRFDEAFVEYKRALELEPLNLAYQANYGGHLAWAGRYDEAIEHLHKIRELDETYGPTLGNLANAYGLKGDHANVVETRAKVLEQIGDGETAAVARAAFANGGWEGYLRFCTSERSPKTQSAYTLAVCHAELGAKDKAISALNSSYENREPVLVRIKDDPRLDPLRDEPRFKELLAKLGFSE